MPPRRSRRRASDLRALASVLGRAGELTALFETLDVLSCALLACVSRGWCSAVTEARARITSVGAIDDGWLDEQLPFWAERHHERVKYFCRHFTMSVVLLFYTGLHELRLGLLARHADTVQQTTLHPLPAADEVLARAAPSLAPLRELVVDQEMSNVGLTLLATFCCGLKTLRLSSGVVSDVGLGALSQGCRLLQRLEIQIHNRRHLGLTHEGVAAIAHGCRQLTALWLPTSPKVGDLALAALGRHCPLLRSLRGSSWGLVTDAAVAALVQGCSRLEVVELPKARLITDAAASALALRCPRLKKLDLRGTRVTEAGLRMLASHAQQMLSIFADCMSESEARALEEEYPVEVERKITVRVRTMAEDDVTAVRTQGYVITTSMPLGKLMRAFCVRQVPSARSAVFRFGAVRIDETQTAAQLKIKDGDDIYVRFRVHATPGDPSP